MGHFRSSAVASGITSGSGLVSFAAVAGEWKRSRSIGVDGQKVDRHRSAVV